MLIFSFLFLPLALGIFYYLYIRPWGTAGNSYLKAQAEAGHELPQSIAERRALLEKDQNNETLLKVNALARLGIETPEVFFIEGMLRKAGLIGEDAERDFRMQAVLLAVLPVLIFGGFGILFSWAHGFFGVTLGALTSCALPLYILDRKGKRYQLEITKSLSELLAPIREALMRGQDVTSTIRNLSQSAKISHAGNPCITFFEEALFLNSQGLEIEKALQQVSLRLEHPRFQQLCLILGMTSKHGTGWKSHFQELSTAILEDLRLHDEWVQRVTKR